MKKANRTPAPLRRAQLRDEASQALREILGRHEVDQQDISVVTGARHQIVQRWCDRGHDSTIPLVDVVGAGHSYPEVARDLLSWAAEKLGCTVVAKRAAASAGDLFAILGSAIDAAHGVQKAVVDAVSPQGDEGTRVSDDELHRIVERATKLEKVAIETRLAAQAELTMRSMQEGMASRADVVLHVSPPCEHSSKRRPS